MTAGPHALFVASRAVTHDWEACGKPPRRILFDDSIANLRQGCMHESSAATSPAMSAVGFLCLFDSLAAVVSR